MQIRGTNLSRVGDVQPGATEKANLNVAGGSAEAAKPTLPGEGYAPSAELVQLIELAKGQPEIRPEAVAAAMERMQQGFFATQSSAEQTADALLQARD